MTQSGQNDGSALGCSWSLARQPHHAASFCLGCVRVGPTSSHCCDKDQRVSRDVTMTKYIELMNWTDQGIRNVKDHLHDSMLRKPRPRNSRLDPTTELSSLKLPTTMPSQSIHSRSAQRQCPHNDTQGIFGSIVSKDHWFTVASYDLSASRMAD